MSEYQDVVERCRIIIKEADYNSKVDGTFDSKGLAEQLLSDPSIGIIAEEQGTPTHEDEFTEEQDWGYAEGQYDMFKDGWRKLARKE